MHHLGLLAPAILLLFGLAWLPSCTPTIVRVTRDGINGQHMGVNIEWLTDEQLSELSEVEGQPAQMLKLGQFYDGMEPGESKRTASEKIVADCYEWVREVGGQGALDELTRLHHADHGRCKEKVQELLGQLEDGEKRLQIQIKLPFCEHVWYSQHHHHKEEGTEGRAEEGEKREGEGGGAGESAGAGEGEQKKEEEGEDQKGEGGGQQQQHEHGHHHRRRWAHWHPQRRRRDHAGQHEDHHGGHTLDDYYKTHLSWLSDVQKTELNGMKGSGKTRSELQEKVMEWYGQMEGEAKEKAGELLKAGCRELIRALLGEEKANEVKKMKEAGTEPSVMAQKANEWIAAMEEGRKKQMAQEYAPTCQKLFGVNDAGRGRRHHEGHGHEHYGHQGDHGQHSVEDYLRTHLAWLSDAQRAEMKTMREAGKSRDEIQQKVMEWFDGTEGETRQRAIELMQGGCRELLKMVLGEERATKVKEMRESGAEMEKMKAQIEEWVAELGDERKKGLASQYKPICGKVFHAAAASGGPKAGRRRREGEGGTGAAGGGEGGHSAAHHEGHHGGHTLEDYFKTHLSWLSDEQKEELKGMKAAGKSRAELQEKVMAWYGAMEDGEAKEKAGELLKAGCRELIRALLGEEKANEVKKMKEAGTALKEIGQKVDEWIGAMEAGRKREMAQEYAPTCRRLFGAEGKSRMRRSRHRHGHRHGGGYRDQEDEEEPRQNEEEGEEMVQLENNNNDDEDNEEGNGADDDELGADHHLDRHRTWLSRKQKKVLKKMRERGHASHELHDKIHQFYHVSPEEVKATARGILQKGCESVLRRVFGDYKAEEIIEAKEEGASNADIDQKIDEALAQIRNPEKREEAGKFAMACRRIFTMIERRRRDTSAPEKRMEELFKSHLSWLSDAQKEELKGMRDGGKGRTEMHQKVMEWFGSMQGEDRARALEKLRDGCRELLVSVVGKENADELKRLKEGGATEAELDAKAQEYIGAVGDEEKKAKAKEFGPACKQIFLAT